MSLENKINEWILVDNQLKHLSEQIKTIRDKKNTMTNNILSYIEDNNLTQTTISIPDGKIKFVKTNIMQGITFKYLETCLNEIIKNENQVNKILEYIKQRRESKQQMEIKRLYNN
jgi:HD superfamily phosphohydrolase